AMQIAAAAPQYVRREEAPADVVAKEREIYGVQARESGKPEKIWDKIIDGKLEKFFQEICLLEQPYIREQDKTVDELTKTMIAKTGEKISIRRFVRFQLGEGLEKRTHDLAAEVAEQLQKS
ncbi:MAG: translation elongation factor Ts, partial [Pseudomonadota bacterium]